MLKGVSSSIAQALCFHAAYVNRVLRSILSHPARCLRVKVAKRLQSADPRRVQNRTQKVHHVFLLWSNVFPTNSQFRNGQLKEVELIPTQNCPQLLRAVTSDLFNKTARAKETGQPPHY